MTFYLLMPDIQVGTAVPVIGLLDKSRHPAKLLSGASVKSQTT
jgi:hypothetical protein